MKESIHAEFQESKNVGNGTAWETDNDHQIGEGINMMKISHFQR